MAAPGDNATGTSRDHEVSRRKLMNFLLGGGVITTLGASLVPVVNFLIPPEAQGLDQNSVVAGKVGELAPNTGKIFKFGNKPGLLVHTMTGEYLAFSAICTHLQCTVQYRPDFQHIWCACHNGHFDLTGKNIQGPPPRPLEEYKVEIQGEDIVVLRG